MFYRKVLFYLQVQQLHLSQAIIAALKLLACFSGSGPVPGSPPRLPPNAALTKSLLFCFSIRLVSQRLG